MVISILFKLTATGQQSSLLQSPSPQWAQVDLNRIAILLLQFKMQLATFVWLISQLSANLIIAPWPSNANSPIYALQHATYAFLNAYPQA